MPVYPRKRIRPKKPPSIGPCAAPGCIRGITSQRMWPLCWSHAADIIIAAQGSEAAFQEAVRIHRTANSSIKAVRASDRFWKDLDQEQGKDGLIYYLQVGERIKIGFSTSIRRRLRAYPPGATLLAFEPGDLTKERERHHQFAQLRVAGREWFMPGPELGAHITELVAEHGDPGRYQHNYRERHTGGPTPRGWSGPSNAA